MTILTPTETKILRTTGRFRTRAIAAQVLGISRGTLNTYMNIIYQKLRVHDLPTAIAVYKSSTHTPREPRSAFPVIQPEPVGALSHHKGA